MAEGVDYGSSIVINAKTLHSVHLRPKKGFDKSLELKLQPEVYVNEAMADDRFLDSLAELQTEIRAKEKEIGEISEYPKLVFLGTGSCAPNKSRNTSGILYRINENSSVVLDCGEGTLTQIIRFYGETEARKVLATVKVEDIDSWDECQRFLSNFYRSFRPYTFLISTPTTTWV